MIICNRCKMRTIFTAHYSNPFFIIHNTANNEPSDERGVLSLGLSHVVSFFRTLCAFNLAVSNIFVNTHTHTHTHTHILTYN